MEADTALIAQPTAEVQRFNERFAAGVAEVVGRNLHSVFTYGASFFPRPPAWRVDIDYHVVLRQAPTDEERADVNRLHEKLRQTEPLAEALDGYYILLSDALAGGHPRDAVWSHSQDGAWGLHRAHIHAGRYQVLRGEDPRAPRDRRRTLR